MLHVIEVLKIEQLALKDGEKYLNDRIIQAISLAAYTLLDTFLSQNILIMFVLILPTLIRMKHWVRSVGQLS